jgi:hypothetical protein
MQVWDRPICNFHLFHYAPYVEYLHVSELLQSFSRVFILALFMRALVRTGNEPSGSIEGLKFNSIKFSSYLFT